MSADADVLVILSDINGLYTADPRRHPDARLIEVVDEITPDILALAGGAGSALGTGGMATKLSAAGICVAHGTDMVIANGNEPELLYGLMDHKPFGTRFIGRKQA